jgi:hypothetical protein
MEQAGAEGNLITLQAIGSFAIPSLKIVLNSLLNPGRHTKPLSYPDSDFADTSRMIFNIMGMKQHCDDIESLGRERRIWRYIFPHPIQHSQQVCIILQGEIPDSCQLIALDGWG